MSTMTRMQVLAILAGVPIGALAKAIVLLVNG